MVGEVETVIRNLAKKGLTMMIVTHEMRFAREVANRVFYMDDGGIYEDGTPEQIFDHPQKERTIRFIRHLKVFEEKITSKDFDFIGLVGQLEEFGRKHRISQKTIYRIQQIFEEICVQIILPELSGDFNLNLAVEYSPETEEVTMRFVYDGKAVSYTHLDGYKRQPPGPGRPPGPPPGPGRPPGPPPGPGRPPGPPPGSGRPRWPFFS